MINVFSGKTWIALRLFYHFLVLIPLLIFLAFAVGSELHAGVFFAVIVLVYSALVYGQLTKPLISLSDEELEVINLFYTGVRKIDKDKIRDIRVAKNRVMIFCPNENISINILGISGKSKEALRSIEETFREKTSSKLDE